MQNSFDFFGIQERPNIILCNPDKTELYSLGLAYNPKLSWRYNALSEFEFEYPESIDNSETINPAYALLKGKRVVWVDGFGYFLIDDVEENLDGRVPIKTVKCSSWEATLIGKKLTSFQGYYYFYRPEDPANSLMNQIIGMAKSWSIGYIDPELEDKYRYFEIGDTTLYAFLMTDVENSYGCVFEFDTENQTISAYKTENATTPTDIFVSFDNLLKSGSFQEISDEIATCLFCYGGDDLDIRLVNPLGTNAIYNFNYYKTTEWISQSLIDAINAWEVKVAANVTNYQELLIDLYDYYIELGAKETELFNLETDLAVKEAEKQAKIVQGEDLTVINAQIAVIQSDISTVEGEITTINANIVATTNSLAAINSDLSLSNTSNFTVEQQEELDRITFENTFQNENIIKTDGMTAAEEQVQSQELYDQGLGVLEKTSIPRYEFSVDVVNFTALQEYSTYTDQLEMGSVITLEVKEGTIVESVLLQMDMNFDNPEDFKMVFSNRLRLDNGRFIYSDLFGQTVKAGSSVSFKGGSWSNWSNQHKDDVLGFVASPVNTAVNNIVVGPNEEILIDANGLTARFYDTGTMDFSPNQALLTSNSLAFTTDNWNTANLALGVTTAPGGGEVYGVVGSHVVGTLTAGTNLEITGAVGANSLVVDDFGGATITIKRDDLTVSAGDSIGKVQFYAADTNTISNFIVANIEAQAAETILTDINPGVLIFRTTPNTIAATPVESFRIDKNQDIVVADGKNIVFDTTVGTEIATSVTQKLAFYGSTPIIQPTALTTQLTTITFDAPITPNYSFGSGTNTSAWGWSTSDDFLSALSVIENLQDRVQELEDKLQSLGLIA